MFTKDLLTSSIQKKMFMATSKDLGDIGDPVACQ